MNNNQKVLIGQGKVSKVYLIEGAAYKCFPASYPLSWIKYEVKIQNEIVSKTKLPILSYEYVNNSREIKMPYIKGVDLTYRVRVEKYKTGLEDLIGLQKQVYEYQNIDLLQAHDVFFETLNKSNLDDSIKKIGIDALNEVDIKNNLCHFDLHFSNIMYDHNNYLIIDWANAKLGNPILDIARTYVILRQYAFRLSDKYLKMISKELDIKLIAFAQAIKAMAVLRLIEMSDDEPKQRILDLIYNTW